MLLLSMFIKFLAAEKAWLEGEPTVLSFLIGKAVIPHYAPFEKHNKNISSINKQRPIHHSMTIPTPTPHFSPTPDTKKKNRPGKRERMRKRKMSEYADELIEKDELTSIEFPVEEVTIETNEKGKFIGFNTKWSNTTEPPYSFIHNLQTLKEKCKAFKDKEIKEIEEIVRKFAHDYDGNEFLPES